jgi:hypothetical protein
LLFSVIKCPGLASGMWLPAIAGNLSSLLQIYFFFPAFGLHIAPGITMLD